MKEWHMNGDLFDGVSMAVFTVNVFLLHQSAWMTRNKMATSYAVMLYLFFWIITNDSDTFLFLSEKTKVNETSLLSDGIQYPLFVLVYAYIFGRILRIYGRKSFKLHTPMYISLFCALVSWLLYEFGCGALHNAVFWGHSVWHVCIGYVAVYLIFIGTELTFGFKRVKGTSTIWPQLTESITRSPAEELEIKIFRRHDEN